MQHGAGGQGVRGRRAAGLGSWARPAQAALPQARAVVLPNACGPTPPPARAPQVWQQQLEQLQGQVLALVRGGHQVAVNHGAPKGGQRRGRGVRGGSLGARVALLLQQQSQGEGGAAMAGVRA